MGVRNVDFDEDKARQGARLWGEVAKKFDTIVQKADGIKGEPWGSKDDKIAQSFVEGEDGFTKVRDQIVAIAKNNLKPALDGVQPELENGAKKIVEQATTPTRKH